MCRLKECPTFVEFRALSVSSKWLDRGSRAQARGRTRTIEAPKWNLRNSQFRGVRIWMAYRSGARDGLATRRSVPGPAKCRRGRRLRQWATDPATRWRGVVLADDAT